MNFENWIGGIENDEADEEIDKKEDITLAVLVLANEMYSNREYTVEKNILNPVITSILDMHSMNLL